MDLRPRLEALVAAYESSAWDEVLRLAEALMRLSGVPPLVNRMAAQAALELGDHARAARHFETALKANSRDSATRVAYAGCLAAQGRIDDAVAECSAACEIQPDYALAHANLGVYLARRGRLENALAAYDRTLALEPGLVETQANRANALLQLGRLRDAQAAFESVLAKAPDVPSAWAGLAQVQCETGRFVEGMASCRRALALDPNNVAALTHLGNLHREQEQIDAARRCYERALAVAPDATEPRLSLGMLLLQRGDVDGAGLLFERAVELAPGTAANYVQLLAARVAVEDWEGAEACLRSGIERCGDDPKLRSVLGVILLGLGRWDEGWRLYQARLERPDDRAPWLQRLPRERYWREGEPVAGRRLLVVAEQGIGDYLFCLGFVRELRRLGAIIVLHCYARLAPLLEPLGLADELVLEPEAARYDCWIALFDLPLLLGIEDPARLSPDHPQLPQPDPERSRALRRQYLGSDAERATLVGLSWRGGADQINRQRKSLELRQLLAHLPRRPGLCYLSVQYGLTPDERRLLEQAEPVVVVDADIEPLNDMVAATCQLGACDFIVSVSNTTVYSASAIGIPVWLLLSKRPDWRWLQAHDATIWYPTIRVFRQQSEPGWAGVLERLAEALPKMTDRERERNQANLPRGVGLTAHADDFRDNPDAIYDRLRAADPLYRDPDYGRRLLTRYSDVRQALREKSFSVNAQHAEPDSYLRRIAATGIEEATGATPYEPPLVLLDDPDHRRIRGLVSKAFNPQSVAAMEDRVVATARELLAAIGERRQIDFIADYAGPLPTRVILEMLGMSPQLAPDFKRWSEDILHGYDPERGEPLKRRLREAFRAMSDHFSREVARRRERGGADLLGALVRAQEEDDRLSDLEIISLCTQLMVAGNVTTTDLMGNGMHALLSNPRQLQRLRAEPSLMERAVEEMLRFDCPITETGRIVRREGEIGGCPVRAGETLTASLAAANHDATQFERPHEFDIGRPDNPHLGFGSGIHVCLGAPLARLEARIGLAEFLNHFPSVDHIDGRPPRRRHLPFFRGFVELPLALDHGS